MKTIKFLFYLFVGLILIKPNISHAQSISDSSKIVHSQQYDYTLALEKDEKLKSASTAFESFLNSRDTNFMMSDINKNFIQVIYEELFPRYLTKNEVEFDLLNIGKEDSSVVISILSRQNFSKYPEEYQNMLYTFNIYKAILVNTKDGWKLNCGLRTDGLEKKKSPFGYYWYDPKKINRSEIKAKAYNKFSKEICDNFGIKRPDKKIDYIISDRNDAMKILGFYYSLNITGLYEKKIDLLIDCTNSPLYKHEIVHYLLEQFNLSKFLSEGIAVYYGGSHSDSFDEFFLQEKNIFAATENDEKSEWLKLFIKGGIIGGEYQPFYYAMSATLIQQFLLKHTSLELTEIMNKTPGITPGEFMKKYLLSNTSQSEEEFLLNILK